MPHEHLEVLVAEVTVRLHDGADVPTLLEELGGELLGGVGFPEGHRVVHDRIHALDAVECHEHEVKDVVIRIRPSKELELRIRRDYPVPFAAVDNGDAGDPGRMELVEPLRVSV